MYWNLLLFRFYFALGLTVALWHPQSLSVVVVKFFLTLQWIAMKPENSSSNRVRQQPKQQQHHWCSVRKFTFEEHESKCWGPLQPIITYSFKDCGVINMVKLSHLIFVMLICVLEYCTYIGAKLLRKQFNNKFYLIC